MTLPEYDFYSIQKREMKYVLSQIAFMIIQSVLLGTSIVMNNTGLAIFNIVMLIVSLSVVLNFLGVIHIFGTKRNIKSTITEVKES